MGKSSVLSSVSRVLEHSLFIDKTASVIPTPTSLFSVQAQEWGLSTFDKTTILNTSDSAKLGIIWFLMDASKGRVSSSELLVLKSLFGSTTMPSEAPNCNGANNHHLVMSDNGNDQVIMDTPRSGQRHPKFMVMVLLNKVDLCSAQQLQTMRCQITDCCSPSEMKSPPDHKCLEDGSISFGGVFETIGQLTLHTMFMDIDRCDCCESDDLALRKKLGTWACCTCGHHGILLRRDDGLANVISVTCSFLFNNVATVINTLSPEGSKKAILSFVAALNDPH